MLQTLSLPAKNKTSSMTFNTNFTQLGKTLHFQIPVCHGRQIHDYNDYRRLW